jgi:hypothetical protein
MLCSRRMLAALVVASLHLATSGRPVERDYRLALVAAERFGFDG